MDVREKLVEIIQNSVGGCTRHWAEVIIDGLIAHGVMVQENCKACAEATQNCIVKLQEQIAEMRSVQEWISVKDRLPENGKKVLVYCNENKNDYEIGAYSDTYRGFFVRQTCYENITHWMPLPPAPEDVK